MICICEQAIAPVIYPVGRSVLELGTQTLYMQRMGSRARKESLKIVRQEFAKLFQRHVPLPFGLTTLCCQFNTFYPSLYYPAFLRTT